MFVISHTLFKLNYFTEEIQLLIQVLVLDFKIQ